MATTEDYKKYLCALGSRSVPRLTGKIQAAELSVELRKSMLDELHRPVQWQRCTALVGWPFDGDERVDHKCDDHECDDNCEAETVVDFWRYSDGSPVLSTVDWGRGMRRSSITPMDFPNQTRANWKRRSGPVVIGHISMTLTAMPTMPIPTMMTG